MSLGNAQASVTTTAAAVVAADSNAPVAVLVKNRGSASVYLGTSTVTSANGFELAAGEDQIVLLDPGEQLYAIAGSGTQRVDALRMRNLARSG